MDKLFVYLTEMSGSSAYFLIFGILVACGLGFPLPEDLPLIATGYLVWDGTMRWSMAIAVTMLGVLIGDTILFFIGRRLGLKILEQGKIIKPQKVRRTKAYFRKYGDKLVFFARFVAGFRAAAFFLAGALNMKYTRFLWWDGLAALVSVPVWIVLGYGLGHYFGDSISQLLKNMSHLKNGFTVVILGIVVIVGARAYFQFKRAKEQKAKFKSAAAERAKARAR